MAEGVIACDQSTTAFGVAIGGPGQSAPRTMVIKGPGANEMVMDRMLAGYAETLGLLIRNTGVKYCIIEAPLYLMDSQHASRTASALIQLTGAIRGAAHRAGCVVSLAAVSTVRKHFIGTGNLRRREAKQAVMDRCRQLGWDVADDNAGDAAALWSYGMSLYYPSWSPRSTPLFAERAMA